MIMKTYVTYKRKKVSENFYADPNTNNAVFEQTGWQITFHETPYEVNGVFVASIEYDGRSVNPTELEYFRTLDPAFEFTILEETEVNTILENFWFDESWVQYVSVDNFEFTDNRPTIDLFM